MQYAHVAISQYNTMIIVYRILCSLNKPIRRWVMDPTGTILD